MAFSSKIKQKCRSFEYQYTVVRARRNYTKKSLRDVLSHIQLQPMDSVQYRTVKSIWGKYKYDSQWFDVYSTLHPNCDLSRFFPDDFFYAYVDPIFCDPKVARSLDDKNFYNLYFPEERQPATIFRFQDGYFLDEHYQLMTKNEAMLRCVNNGQVIAKPAVNSDRGRGIYFWSDSEDVNELFDLFKPGTYYVVQDVIKTHEDLIRLNPCSVNTLRIMTLVWHGEVRIISSIMRMGAGDKRVDNFSAGGLACGIKDDGTLQEKAYDYYNVAYTQHPNGLTFLNYKIPGYDKCIEMVKRMAPRFSRMAKLVSWDLTVCEDENPILIETNLYYSNINIHQICNGPIFGDYRDEILSIVDEK